MIYGVLEGVEIPKNDHQRRKPKTILIHLTTHTKMYVKLLFPKVKQYKIKIKMLLYLQNI